MKLFSCFALLLFPFAGLCQTGVVELQNPSFEFGLSDTLVLPAWSDCSKFKEESWPDVQPGRFGCTIPPVHGKHYIGLVTRPHGTWEQICQTLDAPLQPDSTYWFAVCLAASDKYFSGTRTSKDPINFIAPVKLRIWGINPDLGLVELMAETLPVDHEKWRVYNLEIDVPNFEVHRIAFEAYYPDSDRKTAGNLLLDNCSAFYPNTLKPLFLAAKHEILQSNSPNDIALKNPSFERTTERAYFLPENWKEYLPELKTPHRTHPFHPHSNVLVKKDEKNSSRILYFGKKLINQSAEEGETFTSLLASEDGRRQSISTVLNGVLRKGIGYTFSLSLAYSNNFRQREEEDNLELNYNKPLRIFIWGGTPQNPKTELLAQSASIQKPRWQRVHFVLKPSQDQYTLLTFEADYAPEIGKKYNGNILLDNCSEIIRIK